jgi:autotransporter passenger strand-loop-strand repeat protein
MGGGGVSLDRSTLSNSGTITGGSGAVGVDANYAVLSNSGRIAGGDGGGEAMALGGGNAVNTGTVIGGAGAMQLYTGGSGGDGVYLYRGATLSNSKWLAGGAGGYGEYYKGSRGYGGNGGTGVLISNAVLINAGTISGGAGGGGDYTGSLGDAVAFKNAGTLVVEHGAKFIGDVVANSSYSDVLELTGTSSTALTGIGTQFTNFTDISFASGAAWTIAGNTIGLASGATISGFAAGDTIVLDGFAKVVGFGVEFIGGVIDIAGNTTTGAAITLGSSQSGDLLISSDGTNSTLSVENTLSGITLASGEVAFVVQHGKASDVSVMSDGFLVAQYGGKVTSATIEASGAASVLSGGVMFDTVVDKKAALYVVYGGTAISTTIKNGGLEQVYGGGITSNTVIDGGTLALTNSGGITGTLKFNGKDGVLEVDQTEIPTTVISGFKAGDKVELLDAASGIGTVTVTKANVVTISAGGVTYKLNIAGAKVGETNFKFSGFALTETGSKMAIQRPAETPAAGQALPELLAAGGHQAIAATPAPSIAWSASAAPYAAPSHELIRVAHGGIQTMVTLQSG